MHFRDSSTELKYVNTPKVVSIVGAPMSFGQPLAGTDDGPTLLRGGGLHGMLSGLNWRVDDTGDLTFIPPSMRDPVMDPAHGLCKESFAVGAACKKISDEVERCAREGHFVLTLGGDHSIAAGTCKGILSARPDTGIIWVDAHADINTPSTSGSGNIHGMPVAFLMQKLVDQAKLPGFEWMKEGPFLQPEKLVYVGLRDVDDGEVETIRRLGIKTFTMQHVDRFGIGKVMEMALEHLGDVPLHLSYDIDAVDPAIAPSTGTLVRGGMTYREAHYVAEACFETGQLASLDMVEVNPKLAPGVGADITVEMALGIVTSAMGTAIM